jgi:hypothetical protein
MKEDQPATETWRPVVGFEGLYEVSDHGRVRGVDRVETYSRIDQYSGRVIVVHRHHRGLLLRPGRASTGYLTVMLGRGNTKQVHALVLAAFVGPCPPRHECCHADDGRENNNLNNLRWGTRSDNLHDAVRNGRKPVGERHHHAKLRASDIPAIRARCAEGRGSVVALARQHGVSEATIRQVRDGRAWRSA